ncbi:hypothetical protein [Microbulbifer taiwanensis]|uniref:Uncharacterized protein n=1 Tax=Microbulbifer taiwanensis TaxID=986746 RepID=A0ABW1YMP9_9GAMM|nr:hypothetical protein [Microbulbifer taiwanensis]
MNYAKILSERYAIDDEVIKKFIKQIMKENGFSTLDQVCDFLLRQFVTVPDTHPNYEPYRYMYARIKQMLREEQGGIANVYKSRR